MTHVIYQPARKAKHPAAPVPRTSTPAQLHAEAHAALIVAVHYLNQPMANVPGAARKTVQALSALRKLSVASAAGSAA